MKHKNESFLINNAGNGNYMEKEDIDRVIRYITRTNKHPKQDLIAWGGLGITEFHGIETVIRQFKIAQKRHTRRGNFGRYIDHEEYTILPKIEQKLRNSEIDMDSLARRMANDIYENDHCQVVYAIHRPDDRNLHIHFAINTVNFKNGNKRRETMTQNRNRAKRFSQIIYDEIGKS